MDEAELEEAVDARARREFGGNDRFKYVPVTFAELKKMQQSNSYAGGSTAKKLGDLKDYIEAKGAGDFGSCKPQDFDHCYYAKVPKDVIAAENELLKSRFTTKKNKRGEEEHIPRACNKHSTSNIDPKKNGKGGYVYVCRKGAEPKKWAARMVVKTGRGRS